MKKKYKITFKCCVEKNIFLHRYLQRHIVEKTVQNKSYKNLVKKKGIRISNK